MIRLFNDECIKFMQKQLEAQSIDLILVDLPYGTTKCKWDIKIPFNRLWIEFKRIIKPKRATVLFGSQPFTTLLINSNLEQYKYSWIWDKNLAVGHLVANIRPLQQTEDIAVFGNGKILYNPQKVKRDKVIKLELNKGKKTVHVNFEQKEKYTRETDFRFPTNILKFSNAFRQKLHPTQKPVDLLEYLIQTYTNEGDTVLDCCMGSGSTGIACLNTGRNFIGVEKDEKYFAIAKERIEEHEC